MSVNKEPHQDVVELGSAAPGVAVLQGASEDEGGPEAVAVERRARVEEPVLGSERGDVDPVQADLDRNSDDLAERQCATVTLCQAANC